MMPIELMPLDFEPGWRTRLSAWRAHRRLHRAMREELFRTRVIGQSAQCVHCGRGWIVRQGRSAVCIREARERRQPAWHT